jgi:hypothetical protein
VFYSAAVWKTSTLSDLVRMYLQRSREPLPSGFLENVVFLAKITPYKQTCRDLMLRTLIL